MIIPHVEHIRTFDIRIMASSSEVSEEIDEMIDRLSKLSKDDKEIFMSRLHLALGRKYIYRLVIDDYNEKTTMKFEETDKFTNVTRDLGKILAQYLNKHNLSDSRLRNIFVFDYEYNIPVEVKPEFKNDFTTLSNIFFEYLQPRSYMFTVDTFMIHCDP